MSQNQSLNIIYTFNFNLGEVMLQKIEIEKKSNGVAVLNRNSTIDQIEIEFDDCSRWVCYKPYVYRARGCDKWDRCLFDNESIKNTSSVAFNHIIHNNKKAGCKIEYFN